MGDEHAFTDVDAQPDPSAWVRVLDTLGRDPHYAPYKRRMLDLLGPAAAAPTSRSESAPARTRSPPPNGSTFAWSVWTPRA